MRRGIVVALLVLLFSPVAVFAGPIRLSLQDVTFSDGGTATGQIVIDLDTLRAQLKDGVSRVRLDDVEVTTTGAGGPRTYHAGEGLFAEYMEATDEAFGSYGLITLRSVGAPYGDDHVLLLYLATPLSRGGPATPLLISNGWYFSGEFRVNVLEGKRMIVGGQIVSDPVPEPSTMLLLGMGGTFVALRRRRRRA